MQSSCTLSAIKHADLSLTVVWDHFINMGGMVDRLEVDAYLHGLIPLPSDDRDCVTQAVNELLDDLAMTGYRSCCRAPYSATVPDALDLRAAQWICTRPRRGPDAERMDRPSPQFPVQPRPVAPHPVRGRHHRG